ncbi:MAG TPA: serine/threonine-protein kinase [Polyangiaceae bacterium]|nr:serine/threonine-protein kinase [Polyangiaceae bacterium]
MTGGEVEGAASEGGSTTIDSFVRELARAPDVAPFAAGPAGDRLPIVDPSAYTVEGECGRGGLGRVLRARDERLGRPVAIKELISPTADASARFVREATITGRLQHPGIIPIYEAGRWPGGKPFYAMKLVEGRTLAEALRSAGRARERLALLPNVLAVAEAMAYAHSNGVIHRDLKPANVLVGAFGETVVIDWGLAKDLSRPDGEGAVAGGGAPPAARPGDTTAGARLGTPAYMAPEQAAGVPLDARADVYALGAILYELLTGAPPHAGTNLSALFRRAAAGEWAPLEERAPAVPRDLASVVNKAMAKQPADRYPTAVELADDLRRFQAGLLVTAHRYTPAQLFVRALRRHRAVATVAGALVSLLVALSVYGVRRIVGERDVARRQRAAAESLVDFALVDLREQLTKIGRLEPLFGVGREVDGYYSRLEKTLPDLDDEGRRRRAQAFEVLGDVQDARGERASAVEAYRAGLALREELARRPHAPPRARLDAARTHVRIARALTDVNGDEALAALGRAKALLEPLPDGPLDAEAAEIAGAAFVQTGDVLLNRGDVAQAELAYGRAIDVQGRSRDGADVKVREGLSRAHERLGVAQQQRGGFDRALRSFRASLELREALAAQDASPYHRELVGEAHAKLGTAFQASGDLDAAQAEYGRALDVARQLVALDPTNVGWLHALAAWHTDFGTIRIVRKDLAGAEAAFAEAYHAIDRVAKADPGNARWRRHVAVALSKLGQVKFDRGNLAGARADYEIMVAILVKLVEDDPSNAKARQQLAIAHSYVSDLHLANNEPGPALAAAQAMVDVVKARAGADGGDVAFSKILAVGFGQVASVHERPGGDRGAAQASLRQAVSILEGLRARRQLDKEGDEYLADFQRRLSGAAPPSSSGAASGAR